MPNTSSDHPHQTLFLLTLDQSTPHISALIDLLGKKGIPFTILPYNSQIPLSYCSFTVMDNALEVDLPLYQSFFAVITYPNPHPSYYSCSSPLAVYKQYCDFMQSKRLTVVKSGKLLPPRSSNHTLRDSNLPFTLYESKSSRVSKGSKSRNSKQFIRIQDSRIINYKVSSRNEIEDSRNKMQNSRVSMGKILDSRVSLGNIIKNRNSREKIKQSGNSRSKVDSRNSRSKIMDSRNSKSRIQNSRNSKSRIQNSRNNKSRLSNSKNSMKQIINNVSRVSSSKKILNGTVLTTKVAIPLSNSRVNQNTQMRMKSTKQIQSREQLDQQLERNRALLWKVGSKKYVLQYGNHKGKKNKKGKKKQNTLNFNGSQAQIKTMTRINISSSQQEQEELILHGILFKDFIPLLNEKHQAIRMKKQVSPLYCSPYLNVTQFEEAVRRIKSGFMKHYVGQVENQSCVILILTELQDFHNLKMWAVYVNRDEQWAVKKNQPTIFTTFIIATKGKANTIYYHTSEFVKMHFITLQEFQQENIFLMVEKQLMSINQLGNKKEQNIQV